MADVSVQSQGSNGMTDEKRILQLSRPKDSKMLWITNVGPRVMWGTQETLRPVTDAALSANPTPRLEDLSKPKRNFQTGNNVNRPEFMFSCGRSSVVWEVSGPSRDAEPSSRIEVLAQHKTAPEAYQENRPHYVYSCGRSSPIWNVNKTAKTCDTSSRTEDLTRPKSLHANYQPNREVATVIPRPALSARTTPRLESLSEPKNRPEGPFREPQWLTNPAAQKAVPSTRSLELAKSKPLADGYMPHRGSIWSVSRAAQKTSATSRMDELSRPIIRATMDHVQFDPDAFVVKQTALKAKCTQRLQQLAEPLTR